jgi:hypothetical protein
MDDLSLAKFQYEKFTFMSSTKDGKPPMAMKVWKATTDMSMEPRAYKVFT